jgi:hypothetical protein
MSEISKIQEGSRFAAPIKKTHTGLNTIRGDLDAECPDLPNDTVIAQISSEVSVQEGAMGKGYVKVDTIKESGSGSTRYLWITIKRFSTRHRSSDTSQGDEGVNYTSHVDRSHRDTATPRANQYDSDLY